MFRIKSFIHYFIYNIQNYNRDAKGTKTALAVKIGWYRAEKALGRSAPADRSKVSNRIAYAPSISVGNLLEMQIVQINEELTDVRRFCGPSFTLTN